MPTDRILTYRCETTLVGRGRHSIQDRTAKDDLAPLPGCAPGAQTISDNGRVSEERILHSALTMVP